jgi:hypothetical protein
MFETARREARHDFRHPSLPFWVEVPHVIVTGLIAAVPSPLYAGVEVPGSGTATIISVVLVHVRSHSERRVSDFYYDDWHMLGVFHCPLYTRSRSQKISRLLSLPASQPHPFVASPARDTCSHAYYKPPVDRRKQLAPHNNAMKHLLCDLLALLVPPIYVLILRVHSPPPTRRARRLCPHYTHLHCLCLARICWCQCQCPRRAHAWARMTARRQSGAAFGG